MTRHIHSTRRSWSSPPRTRPSITARIPCPNRRWTDSCCASASTTLRPRTRGASCWNRPAAPASPWGHLAWRNAGRAVARVDGRDYVLPDDLKAIAVAALAHRVVVAAQADTHGRSSQDAERILLDIMDRVPVL